MRLEPRTKIFPRKEASFGKIPGPIRVDVVGDTIWCGGGHTFSRVFRFHEGAWTAKKAEPLLNFVIAVGPDEAYAGGEDEALGHTVDGGATWTWDRLGNTSKWLISYSRDRAGRIWIGHESGAIYRRDVGGRAFEKIASVKGTVNTVRQYSNEHAVVVTESAVHRLELATGKTTPWMKHAELIDAACDDRGRIVLISEHAEMWICEDGEKFEEVELDDTPSLDAIFWFDGLFAILGYDGVLRVSSDARTWKPVAIQKKAERLGGVASYRGGWLVGTSREGDEGYGSLWYLGDPANAPALPVKP